MSEWTHVLDSLSEQKLSNRVTLSLPSSLALKWIVPALPRAQEAGLDLSLEVQDEVVSPKSAGSHVTIRFGRGPYPGFFVSHLSNCDLWPVARPGVVQSKSIRDADASGKIRFLKDKRGELDGTDYCWSAYFQGLEKDDTEVGSGLYFERADLMLQAAIGGMGVALGRTLLIENDLNDGFLEIVGPPARIPSKYWVVTTSEFAQTEVFPKLLHWLRQEIVRTRRTISSAQPEQ
jgi:LysR family glycine cleavage system transcriptional activator